MLFGDKTDLASNSVAKSIWKRYGAVLLSFSVANDHLTTIEVHILDA